MLSVLPMRLLARFVRFGDVTIIDAQGLAHRLGGPALPGVAPVVLAFKDPLLPWKLALDGEAEAGEAYMDGRLVFKEGRLDDLIAIASESMRRDGPPARAWSLAVRLAALIQQHNPVERAGRNVAHHYDLSGELYSLFLDEDRQYSCAYFARPGMSLEEAQEAKKRRIAAKLLLRPGMKVLDVGSGWGGLAIELARSAEIEVLGITLSREQLELSRRRAAEAGLAGRVRFEALDYREVEGDFDRIVSVGMFEHVGKRHYGEFFRVLRKLLAPGGVALLHSIGRSEGPGLTNPWIRKYIFPGGYSPALSEVLPAVEDSRLWVTDLEVLRLHYADTIAEWQRRFQANRARIAKLYDERFCRMWEFYLAGARASFTHQGHMVFQMQLAREIDAVPRIREYMRV